MSFSIRPYRRFSASSSQALPTALLAFLILVPAAAAQGVGDFFFGDLRAEIADLRAQLARCDGPPNLALTNDNCRARTLVQAKLNQLLKMGVMMGETMDVGVGVGRWPLGIQRLGDAREAVARRVEPEHLATTSGPPPR